MAATSSVVQSIKGLKRFLDHEDAVVELTEGRLSGLSKSQKDKLIILTQPLRSPSPEEERSVNSSDELRHKRARGGPRNPWRVVLKMEVVKLPQYMEAFIQKSGPDPVKFLNDDGALKHRVSELDRGKVADAYFTCLLYVSEVEKRQGLYRLRWLFCMILFYDLVRLIRPGGSGKIGSLMEADLRSFLGDVEIPGNVSAQETLDQLNRRSHIGKKLSSICAHLGSGSLFFLVEQLSPDFLKSKYRASGKYNDEAIRHLRRLGIEEKAKDTRMTELSDNARRHFLAPFLHAMITHRTSDRRLRSPSLSPSI